MDATFDPNIPIYLQLCSLLKRQIVSGALKPGEKIASVRDLAAAFCVNPNTLQRALSELEREALIYTERTAGRYVTADTAQIQATRDALAQELLQNFLTQMEEIGFSPAQLSALMERRLKQA